MRAELHPIRLLGLAWRGSRRWSRRNPWVSFTVAVTGVTMAAILVAVVLPAYKDPSSRIYTSKFGYSAILRRLKKPFPVTVGRAERRDLSRVLMAEGMVRSEPIQVPVIPMGKVAHVSVRDGDRVYPGQILAEIDSERAQIKADAAKAALETARAELERVKIGSAYVLAYERPGKSGIVLDAARKEAEIQARLVQMNRRLADRGFLAESALLQQQQQTVATQANLREAEMFLSMAEKGQVQSLRIAESAVVEAELALKHRSSELADYRVAAPVAGVVERVLIHEGEYNQDPGKPAFLVSSGSWFEANYDQATLGRVRVGDRAEVRLEAWAGRLLVGRVTYVIPFVRFDLGGPESTRPIRPTGTGAPEWPATFAVRIEFDPKEVADLDVVPGLTGFSRIVAGGPALALPRGAVSAISGGKGMVYLIRGDRFEAREVTLGATDGDWTEVRDGLRPDEDVIVDGQQVLEPGDRVAVARSAPSPGRDR